MNDTAYVTFEDLETRALNNNYYYKDFEPTLYKVGEDYIFDEDLSVKKNREMVMAHNLKVKEQAKNRMENRNKVRKLFHDDCVSCLMGTYGWNFNKEIAEKIVNTIESKDCDSDYEFVHEMDRLADFVADILRLNGQK